MKIFIGYDKQFEKNIRIQIDSIINNSSKDLQISLLNLTDLNDILYRKRDKLQTTDSAFTRWLVPYLSDYSGWSLYMDSDMLCRADIFELFSLNDDQYSAMVVKHKCQYKDNVKFNGNYQTYYDRKNWSSLILFNNNKCRNLTLDYINTASGLELHQFKWLNDSDIGEIPPEWNHLVGINSPNKNAKIVHWTLGGPWFSDYKTTEFSDEWFQKLNQTYPDLC
jgi:lipopolysaccharide biosynthesis glycosyltransferase